MLFNDSMMVSINDQMFRDTDSPNSSYVSFHLFTGTMPTFAEFDQAARSFRFSDSVDSDSEHGKIFVKDMLGFLRTDHSGTELARLEGPTNDRDNWEHWNAQHSVYDLSRSPEIMFDVLVEGQADYFLMMQLEGSARGSMEENDREVYSVALGTVGNPESGADLEVSSTDITADKVLKLATLRIQHF